MTSIDGKGLADAILNNLMIQLAALPEPLHMAAVCIGDDPGTRQFVKIKQRAAQSVGIEFSTYLFDDTKKNEVQETLRYLAADERIQGIFVELPLPKGWDLQEVLSLIPAEKDVDALTKNPRVSEPAVVALDHVCTEYAIDVRAMRVAVVGQGRLIGEPIARWLGERGADVSRIDIDTTHPAEIARQAEMVVTGVGIPELVTADWISDDAIVIDYGYGRRSDGSYAGDVDFDAVAKKAKYITPVPGGMGPLVVAAVLENLLTLAL